MAGSASSVAPRVRQGVRFRSSPRGAAGTSTRHTSTHMRSMPDDACSHPRLSTVGAVMSRYHLCCPGCAEVFVARLGVEPTSGTRFYLPCPHCDLPIRGSMSGRELADHRIRFECDVVNGADP